jgi:hypothetical protein
MTKSDPSDVEILAQFESVISQDLRAYERPDACVYQITDAEVLQYYRLVAQPVPELSDEEIKAIYDALPITEPKEFIVAFARAVLKAQEAK